MGGLENLKTRLNYQGGDAQGRLNKDKLNSLKQAIKYAYQDAIIQAVDKENPALFNRELRCLINPIKLKDDYDEHLLSIPYGETEDTTLSVGDTFYWPEDDSYWIVFLHHTDERAYFKASIRQCKKEITINKKTYKIYYRGPVETTIQWNLKKSINTNSLNYSAIIYITKNEETLEFFHRFAKVEIDNKPFEVKTVNSDSGDGIIEICLGETFSNSLEKERQKELEEKQESLNNEINGPINVIPYRTYIYTISENFGEGEWILNSKKARISSQTATSVTIDIVTGKSGKFDLIYKTKEKETVLAIAIDSI